MQKTSSGLVRDLNPGPLAPEARIMPLDQQALYYDIFVMATNIYRLTVCYGSMPVNPRNLGPCSVSRDTFDPQHLCGAAKVLIGPY